MSSTLDLDPYGGSVVPADPASIVSMPGVTDSGPLEIVKPSPRLYPCVVISGEVSVTAGEAKVISRLVTDTPSDLSVYLYLDSGTTLTRLGILEPSGLRCLVQLLGSVRASQLSAWLSPDNPLPSGSILALT